MKLQDQNGFVRIARALAPYLDQLVIGGAWCHRLLRFHPLATAPAFTTLMTEDADIVAHEHIRPRAKSIDDAMTDGGFRAKLTGNDRLPVTKYYPDDDDHGMYVEFIAPLIGGVLTRSGEPVDLVKIVGITAQKLRYVELLIFEPWHLELTAQQGFDVGAEKLVVRIASPASYLAQKVLTLQRRQNLAKRPKDALYIHDTLTMFGDKFTELRAPAALVLALLPRKTEREFHKLRIELFEGNELMARAAEISASTGRASPPSPQTIRGVCTVGLEKIFAP